MKRAAAMLAAFLAGVVVALVAGVLIQPAGAAQPAWQPTSAIIQPEYQQAASSTARQTGQRTSITPTTPTASPAQQHTPSTPMPVPTSTQPAAMVAAQQAAGGMLLGWAGQVQCYNCSPFTAVVKLSHYNPTAYDVQHPQLNCWDYSEKHNYCLSPTWIGIPWESGWGLWAACPVEWVIGTWVEIPSVGAFICVDHGQGITCQDDGTCRVDILGPGGAAWDGNTYPATLWVPRSWLIRYAERMENE